jgi:tRNA pseudouridine65 synthase
MTLDLLYLDDAVAVIAKPAGLPTHPGFRTDGPSCMALLRNQLGRWVYPAHRLDSGTSGVLVFGLTPAAAAGLGAAFRNGTVAKKYLAIVRGYMPAAGRIERPLARVTPGGDTAPKAAVTEFSRLQTTELPWPVRPYATARYSLVRLQPHTGRTHQLRRHMAGIAHPIIGDTRYGDGAHNAEALRRVGSRRLLLHAAGLAFPHPLTGATVACDAPLCPEFRRAAAAMELELASDAGGLMAGSAALSADRGSPPAAPGP